MRQCTRFLVFGSVIRFGLGVVVVLVGSTTVRGEVGLFAQYDWVNDAEDVSGSPLRHDGVLDPGITVSDGRVHLEGWDGVDLGYMPELDGAHEVLLRFEDVTLNEYPDGRIEYPAVLAGGGGGGPSHWLVEMTVDDPDFVNDPSDTYLTFEVGSVYSAAPRWEVGVLALTGTGLQSVNHFDSIEFRFTAAAPAGEQLAIRWNDGAWVTGGVGEGTLEEFPSPLPTRLNDGFRTDWDPMWADLGTVSFYSDQANIPEPSAVVLLMFGAVVCVLWQCRRVHRRCSFWKGDEAMLRGLYPLVILVALSGSAQVHAASFDLLGQFPHSSASSHAWGVSADGEVVVGASRKEDTNYNFAPFRWTADEGMVDFAGLLPNEDGRAYDVSADGSVVVGTVWDGAMGDGYGINEAFRWTEEDGVVILPGLPGWEDYRKEATAVSADGSVIVGAFGAPQPDRLFRWTEAEGMVDLGPQFGGQVLDHPHVSADGSVIVANDGQGAFRWTEATDRVYLGTLPGALGNANAYDVSADGSVIVGGILFPGGEYGYQAFRWTEDEGIVLLFDAPRLLDSIATAVSGDGSLIAGTWHDSVDGFIWDEANGSRDLHQVLEDQYGLEIDDFQLREPRDISPDGRVIVGAGVGVRGFEAWRAVIPIPEPSVTVSLITGLLTLLLFVASRRRKGLNVFSIPCSHSRGDRPMLRNLWVFPLVILVLLTGSAQAVAASFELLGSFDNPDYPLRRSSDAYSVSADGLVVVGSSDLAVAGHAAPFRWTAAEGIVNFAGLTDSWTGKASDVSADGSVVVGRIRPVGDVPQAFRWTQEEGVVILSIPPGWEGYARTTEVSADGSTVVGMLKSDADDELFRWTESEGMVSLGPLLDTYSNKSPSISADGSVIVGNDDQGAFRWTQQTGRVYLGTLPGAVGNALADDVSDDGSTIVGSIRFEVGEFGDQPFRWTEEEGFALLFGEPSNLEGRAKAVSGDGSVVIGHDYNSGGFIWDAQHGARNLQWVLEEEYGLNLDSLMNFGWVTDISADGRVIIGTGQHNASVSEAWRVVIPEPSTTASLITGLLTLLLFVASRRRNDRRCV